MWGKNIGKSRGTIEEKVDEQQDFYKGEKERRRPEKFTSLGLKGKEF